MNTISKTQQEQLAQKTRTLVGDLNSLIRGYEPGDHTDLLKHSRVYQQALQALVDHMLTHNWADYMQYAEQDRNNHYRYSLVLEQQLAESEADLEAAQYKLDTFTRRYC